MPRGIGCFCSCLSQAFLQQLPAGVSCCGAIGCVSDKVEDFVRHPLDVLRVGCDAEPNCEESVNNIQSGHAMRNCTTMMVMTVIYSTSQGVTRAAVAGCLDRYADSIFSQD